MKYTFALCFLMIMAALDANAQPKPGATLIITNAAIYTVDNQHPRAEAVAVIGDRIVAVGSKPEIDSWRGPQTEVIDAGGKLLLPGFNDAHLHFIQGGAQLDQVALTDASTPQEFAKRIAEQVSKTPKGEWVLGGRWDETKWPDPQLPTRQLVDPVHFQRRRAGADLQGDTTDVARATVASCSPGVGARSFTRCDQRPAHESGVCRRGRLFRARGKR